MTDKSINNTVLDLDEMLNAANSDTLRLQLKEQTRVKSFHGEKILIAGDWNYTPQQYTWIKRVR